MQCTKIMQYVMETFSVQTLTLGPNLIDIKKRFRNPNNGLFMHTRPYINRSNNLNNTLVLLCAYCK